MFEGTVLFNFALLVFLALSRHSPQAASALETLLGCEQREPENRRSSRVPSSLLEWPRRQEEGEAKLFEMLTHLLSLPGTLVFDLLGPRVIDRS